MAPTAPGQAWEGVPSGSVCEARALPQVPNFVAKALPSSDKVPNKLKKGLGLVQSAGPDTQFHWMDLIPLPWKLKSKDPLTPMLQGQGLKKCIPVHRTCRLFGC